MTPPLQEDSDLLDCQPLLSDDLDASSPSQLAAVASSGDESCDESSDESSRESSDNDRIDEGTRKRKRGRGAHGEGSVNSQIIKKKQAKPIHQGQTRLIP
jgi:hypothetical protein